MRLGILAFLLGILLLQQCTTLPPILWAAGLVLSASAALFLNPPWRMLAWLACGFLWALLQAHFILDKALVPELEGEDVIVTGYVASLPETRGRRIRFLFDVESLEYQQQRFPSPGRVRLSVYKNAIQPRAGEHWQLQVRLKAPHGFMNPGGFDYEGWLYQNRIRATGYVRKSPKNHKLEETSSRYFIQRLRETLQFRLKAAAPENSHGGMLRALAIGDRTGITPQQWAVLQRTGTSHLVAISGLHIGLVAGLAFMLMNGLWRRSGRLMLYLPAPKAAALAAMMTALVYAALAGFSIPTQRALIMLSVIMLMLLANRRLTPGRSLCFALLGVLMFDPFAVMAAGFWLSFAAVAVIVYGLAGRIGGGRVWLQWGRTQWWVTLGLMPVLLIFFQQVSLIAPLANLFAIPLISLLVTPMVLLGSVLLLILPGIVLPEPGQWLVQLSAWMMDGLMMLLTQLSSLSFATYHATITGFWSGLLAFVGVMLLLAPRGIPGRWLGVILILPVVMGLPPKPREGEAWFTLLDVGQGLAAVVQTHEHVLVFDTGPRFSAYFDTGEAVLTPFLRQAGVRRIDHLLISHGDNDHLGGMMSLLKQFPAKHILSSEPKKLAQKGLELTVTPCAAGQQWRWDGVRFEILHPQPQMALGKNDRSCVLKVSSGNHSVLLTGDIEKTAERALLKYKRSELQADILVAPHHGSKTSSTPDFIDAVAPKVVLFPAGYRNRYRFPHARVMARYHERQITMQQTGKTGAIRYILGHHDSPLRASFYRQQAGRYWHHLMKSGAQHSP